MKNVPMVLFLGCLFCIGGARRVVAASSENSLDAWKAKCIEKARHALHFTEKFRTAKTIVEKVECLDAEAKFIRWRVVWDLWATPVKLREALVASDLSNDLDGRHKAIAAIKKWAESEEVSAVSYVEHITAGHIDGQVHHMEAMAALMALGLPKNLEDALDAVLQDHYTHPLFIKVRDDISQWASERDKVKAKKIDYNDDLDTLGLAFKESHNFEIYWHLQWNTMRTLPYYDETNILETLQILYGHALLNKEEFSKQKGKVFKADALFRECISLLDYDELGQEAPFLLWKVRKAEAEQNRTELWRTYGDEIFESFTLWLPVNFKHLYLHPKEKRLKLDLESRKEGIATSQYRRNHPWGANEGPNRTDPKKLPPRPGK